MNAVSFIGFLSFVSIRWRRNRYDIFDFFQGLWQGEISAWGILAAIVGFISFCALYKKVTGKDLVSSKKEHREARHRGKHVLWEYKRDQG